MKLAEIRPANVSAALHALRPRPLAQAMNRDAQRVLPFAQHGTGADDAIEVLGTLIRDVFALPGEERFDPMRYRFPATRNEHVALIATVLQAARGRRRMDEEHVIWVPEFAALAGVDPSYVRRLAREAVLSRAPSPREHNGSHTRAPIAAISAQRFLGKRGVQPWSEAAS